MSDEFEGWEEVGLPDGAARPTWPTVSATTRVLRNGALKLTVFLNKAMCVACGEPETARVRISPEADHMIRLDFGEGLLRVVDMGAHLRTRRIHFSAPKWLPARDSAKHSLKIVRQDETGVTLGFDMAAWASSPPPCAQAADRALGAGRRAVGAGHDDGAHHHPHPGRLPGGAHERGDLGARRGSDADRQVRGAGEQVARRQWGRPDPSRRLG